MRRPSWGDGLRYRFDNVMARGTVALFGWLAIVYTTFVLAMAALTTFIGLAGLTELSVEDFSQTLWRTLMRTLAPGLLAQEKGALLILLPMLFAAIGGMFLYSSLTGILAAGIQSRVRDLRKGRSFVVESDHTLILGWSHQVFTVVSELIEAYADRPACLVILAERDKVTMEDELQARVGSTGRTRIVCRTGNPIDPHDLEIVNPHSARSIIVLAPEVEEPDTLVLKTIFAITRGRSRKAEPYQIAAELHDPSNVEVVRLIADDEVRVVLVGDLIARIAAQTGCQSGLAVVYSELLNFHGNEVWFKEEPGLVGMTFGQALLAYEGVSLKGFLYRQRDARPPQSRTGGDYAG